MTRKRLIATVVITLAFALAIQQDDSYPHPVISIIACAILALGVGMLADRIVENRNQSR